MRGPSVKLLDNATLFVNEAIRNARRAKRQPAQWSFAILHLVQALELLMKHVLQLQHPLFIYENIDHPKNTVSLGLCFERLKSVAQIQVEEREERVIRRASAQRNKIVHHEHDLNPDYYFSIFIELFEFIHYFYAKHLDAELHDRIDQKLWRAEAELLAKFQNEWVVYRGQRLPRGLPFDIVTAQRYTTVRKCTENGFSYIPRGTYDGQYGPYCPDCGVSKDEFHTAICDIEACPSCGNQLLMCLAAKDRCNVEYWMPVKGKGLPG